jgi:hypothetical protein
VNHIPKLFIVFNVACHAPYIEFHASKCRYLPVALFAVAWVNTKVHTANESMPLSKRFGDIARMLRWRVFGEETHLHESFEMQQAKDSESLVSHTVMTSSSSSALGPGASDTSGVPEIKGQPAYT